MMLFGAHPELPGLINHLSHSHVQVGAAGERLSYILLEQQGYVVSNVHPGECRGDLRVITKHGEIMKVEVKTARAGKDGRWHFNLRVDGHSDHRHSDIVILLCVLPSGYVVPFVVPVPAVAGIKQVNISSNPEQYKGKFSRYRQLVSALSLDGYVQ